MLPEMTVINTCDYNQTKAATLAIADHHGPVYLRFGRPVVANFTPADTPAENQQGFDEASTLNYVKNLKDKLLLIHGSIDDVVVMQNNYALLKKFIEAEKQIDFFVYPMHKHNVLGKDRLHLMTKVLNYVIDNNK